MIPWSSARASLAYISTFIKLSGTAISLVYDDMTIDSRNKKALKIPSEKPEMLRG